MRALLQPFPRVRRAAVSLAAVFGRETPVKVAIVLRQPPRVFVVPEGPFAGRRFADLLPEEFVTVAYGAVEPRAVKFVETLAISGDSAIDVGASYGYFTVLLARSVGPTGAVVAVEPDAASADRLRRNLQLNDCGNVQIAGVAASDAWALVRFESPAGAPWDGHIAHADPRERGSGCIAAAPLDAVAALAPRPVRLVKIDVEGAEVAVVRGAAELLRDDRPILIVECHSARSDEELTRFVTQFGYERHLLADEGPTRRHVVYCASGDIAAIDALGAVSLTG